jgi:hypothetical protein
MPWALLPAPRNPPSPSRVYNAVEADEVAEADRTTHREWLTTNPNTKGDKRTRNLWFDDDGPSKANGFARKWMNYRLPCSLSNSVRRRIWHRSGR